VPKAVLDRLARARGLLVVHLGTLLILLGAMWGSETGHRLAGQWTGRAKISTGYIKVEKAAANNTVTDADGSVVGPLPFQLRLTDLRVEYYDPSGQPWLLAFQPAGEADPVELDWELGQPTSIPGTDLTVEVLQFLEHARPNDIPLPSLRIIVDGVEYGTVPAKPGEEVRLDERHVTIRIVDVTQYSLPHVPEMEAINVQFTVGDADPDDVLLWPTRTYKVPGAEDVVLSYVPPEPLVVIEDPSSDRPGMEVIVSGELVTIIDWLYPWPGEQVGYLSLGTVLEGRPPAELWLARRSTVKSLASDIVVLEEGERVARKSIEVNDPLHYGGYFFYQSGYDDVHHGYTVLSVSSDSGLWVVRAGWVLLGVGVFWWGWGTSLAARLRRRS